ncbi:uncharacterized protein LOC123679182 [Harmonia axyridis]|uniref:uncharacterized protein LOC123679182 n=1 Tax=Harmonia axyridis TaxID=115357 RepID=UPI001E2774C8|nr:uncharacterized protein LOC123679182 [Harmonia axyridis]
MIEKRLILSIFFAVLVMACTADKFEDWKDQMKKLQGKCAKQLQVDEASIEELLKSTTVDVSSSDIQKVIKCIVLEIGFVDANGNIGMAKVVEHLKGLGLDDKTIKEVNDKCNSIEKVADQNELVGRYYKCYEENLPRKYLVF